MGTIKSSDLSNQVKEKVSTYMDMLSSRKESFNFSRPEIFRTDMKAFSKPEFKFIDQFLDKLIATEQPEAKVQGFATEISNLIQDHIKNYLKKGRTIKVKLERVGKFFKTLDSLNSLIRLPAGEANKVKAEELKKLRLFINNTKHINHDRGGVQPKEVFNKLSDLIKEHLEFKAEKINFNQVSKPLLQKVHDIINANKSPNEPTIGAYNAEDFLSLEKTVNTLAQLSLDTHTKTLIGEGNKEVQDTWQELSPDSQKALNDIISKLDEKQRLGRYINKIFEAYPVVLFDVRKQVLERIKDDLTTYSTETQEAIGRAEFKNLVTKIDYILNWKN